MFFKDFFKFLNIHLSIIIQGTSKTKQFLLNMYSGNLIDFHKFGIQIGLMVIKKMIEIKVFKTILHVTMTNPMLKMATLESTLSNVDERIFDQIKFNGAFHWLRCIKKAINEIGYHIPFI